MTLELDTEAEACVLLSSMAWKPATKEDETSDERSRRRQLTCHRSFRRHPEIRKQANQKTNICC